MGLRNRKAEIGGMLTVLAALIAILGFAVADPQLLRTGKDLAERERVGDRSTATGKSSVPNSPSLPTGTAQTVTSRVQKTAAWELPPTAPIEQVANSKSPETKPLASPAQENERPKLLKGVTSGKLRIGLSSEPLQQVTLRALGKTELLPLSSSSGSHSTVTLAGVNQPLDITRQAQIWRLGTQRCEGASWRLKPEKSPGLWIGERLYRGEILLLPRGHEEFIVVNELPLEEYVASVVDSETPAAFPVEARLAQAIVARTYAVQQRETFGRGHEYDLLDSPEHSQNYLGFQYRAKDGRLLAGETQAGRDAVAATIGQVCVIHGKLMMTYYSACCGGRTTVGTELFPDAKEIPSVVCDGCQAAPLFHWEGTISHAELERQLQEFYRQRKEPLAKLTSLETEKTVPGRLPVVTVKDGPRQHTLRSTELQPLLSGQVHSPQFVLEAHGDQFVIHGRGHGHGVGLCQWGAKGLAEKGWDHPRILSHYYPGSELRTLQ